MPAVHFGRRSTPTPVPQRPARPGTHPDRQRAGDSGQMAGLLEPLPQRGNVTQLVVRRIKEALLAGELRPGERLPSEPELAKRWGLGRTSVREALKMLVAVGALKVRRSEGTFVVESVGGNALEPLVFGLLLEPGSRAELLEFRTALELDFVELAVRRATEEDLQAMESAIAVLEAAALEAPPDPLRLAEADLAFHRAVQRATHNRFLVKVGDAVLDFFAASLSRAMDTPEHGRRGARLHRSLQHALRARDPEAARGAAEEAMRSWHDEILTGSDRP